jgi:hypothetical protein
MLLAGLIGCLWGIAGLVWGFIDLLWPSKGFGEIALFVAGSTFPGLVQGIIVAMGAFKMRKLQAYGFVILVALVVMLPLSPGIVIGLPMGIWSLVVLRNPQVIAAFANRAEELRKQLVQPENEQRTS